MTTSESTEERPGHGAEVGEPAARTDGRRLVRRILVFVPGSVVPAVLALVTSMIFTRVFTPAEFGMFSLAGVVVAIPLKTISTTWLVQSIAKFLPPQRTEAGRRRTLDAVLLAIAVIAAVQVVLGLVAILVGRAVLSEQWHRFLVPVAVFVVAISVFEILSSLLAAEGRAHQYTTFAVVNSVLTLGLRLLFISSLVRMDVTAMLWSLALSNAVLVPLMWRRVGLARPGRALALSRSPELRGTARSFVGYGLPMTLWLFSSILLDVGDRWVLNGLLGSGAVGIYDANYRLIGGVAALLVVPVTIAVHPYMMSLSGSDDGHVGHVIGTVIDNLVIVTLLAVGLTTVLREDIALVLLGPEFRSGNLIMPLVLAGVFCANIGTFAHKPFELVGRTAPMVVGGFLAAAVNVALCFLLIPAVGYVGAAWATLFSYLLYAVLVGVLGRRIIPWHLDVRRILRLAVVIAAGVSGLLLLRSSVDVGYLAELAMTAVGCAVLSGAVLLSVIRRPGVGAASEVDA